MSDPILAAFTSLSRPAPEAMALLQGKASHDAAGATDIYSAVARFQQRLDRADADRLKFSIGRLDRATGGGVEPGEFVAILGRTATCKTMWLQNLIRHQVKQWADSAFLFVELEMPREQLVRRFLRMTYNRNDAQLDAAIKTGQINLDQFCDAFQHLYFVDQGSVSLANIARYAEDLQRQLGDVPLKAVFVDHAGLIRAERTSSAYERATETAIGLKQLARKLNVAVFCVVQANRAGNRTDGEPVNLEAARDSGAFEENADFVLAFSALTEPAGQAPFVKMRLAKNRRGPSVPALVGFDPHSLKMAERDEARDGE